MRLLLAARNRDGAIAPPAVLVLGGAAGGAMGLAFTPFALTEALPTTAAVVVLVLETAVLLGTLSAWGMLRRAS